MQNFKTWLRVSAVALVTATLLAPTAFYLQSWRASASAIKREYMKSEARSPHLLLSTFDSHFYSHYGFRKSLITAANTLRYRLFHVSPAGNVVLGKEGWLFYYDAADGTIITDYRRSNIESQEKLDTLCRILVGRRDFLRRQGTEYVLMIAPNKGAIYPEYLPDSLAGYSGPDRYDTVMNYLSTHTDLHLVDTKKALLEAKKTSKYPLYEKNGTRWNDLGTFVAYTELCRTLKTIYPAMQPKKLSDFTIGETNCVRDLELMLGVSGYPTPSEPVLLSPGLNTTNFGIRGIVSFVNPSGRPGLLPRTLVFRDCFCTRFANFLADDCERFDANWTPFFNINMAQSEKPGLLIQEFVARYMDYLHCP